MALKYSIEYNDVKDITHRLEIYDDTYVSTEIEVFGRVFLDYAETDDALECIRGQGLRVELDADSTMTFEDLYSEEQQTFPVIYKRDSVTIFSGWLNPEGWFEDYVNDKWKVSFDCIDGLSFLTDLAFVDDSTGLYFTGTKTQLEFLSLALIRTGLQQNINIDIQIYYTGLSATSITENVEARAVRYIKEDKGTIMSCEEVIRDILEPYGACLTAHKGEWYIYKPNQIFNDATLTYYSYDYEGTALNGGATSTMEIDFDLGSESVIDTATSLPYYPHHCSANQSIRNLNSLGAYRVNYKYGEAKSLIGNSYFEGTDPLTDWVTNATQINTDVGLVTVLTFNDPGITLKGELETNNPVRGKLLTTELVGISEGDLLKYRFKANCDLPVGIGWEIEWVFRIYSTDAVDANPLYSSGTAWGGATPVDIKKTFHGGEVIFEKEMLAVPQDGKVFVELWSAETMDAGGGLPPVGFKIDLTEFAFEPIEDSDNNIEGEFHTVERITKPSKEVEDVKEVYTGDSASDLYVGTLYKSGGNTPTTTWYRTGITESYPILQIMGEENLRLYASVQRVFSGDVYGFFSYLSRVTIDGFTGKIFMPIKYSYDTMNNIINCEFREIFGDELTADIFYQKTLDYGKVVTPTITG